MTAALALIGVLWVAVMAAAVVLVRITDKPRPKPPLRKAGAS